MGKPRHVGRHQTLSLLLQSVRRDVWICKPRLNAISRFGTKLRLSGVLTCSRKSSPLTRPTRDHCLRVLVIKVFEMYHNNCRSTCVITASFSTGRSTFTDE